MDNSLAIDLASRAFISDPYLTYRRLREAEQPYWLPHEDRCGTPGLWLFTRYSDVASILRNTQTISKDLSRLVSADRLTAFDRTLMNTDPPRQTRLRALLAPHFSVRRTADLEAGVAAIVERLLTDMAARGEVDFMAECAVQLPLLVVAGIIGVPRPDMPLLKGLTDQFVTGFDSARATPDEKRKVGTSVAALTDYLARLIRQPNHSENTVVGRLTRMRQEMGKPSEEDLLASTLLLVLAGYETTINLLGNGLLSLLSHPAQLDLLRQNLDLMPGAIDEMLRFESPVQRTTFRITTAPCRIGRCELQEGQQVSAVLGAANRDPEQFPSPDAFDIRRSPNQHLAFGAGIHKCLGERLARAEARIVFERLLQRFPTIELLDSEPDWKDQTLFRGLRTLRVRLTT